MFWGVLILVYCGKTINLAPKFTIPIDPLDHCPHPHAWSGGFVQISRHSARFECAAVRTQAHRELLSWGEAFDCLIRSISYTASKKLRRKPDLCY